MLSNRPVREGPIFGRLFQIQVAIAFDEVHAE